MRFTAVCHHEDGRWWATSDQAPGWTAAANDPDELWELVAEAPAFLFGWTRGEYSVLLVSSEVLEVA